MAQTELRERERERDENNISKGIMTAFHSLQSRIDRPPSYQTDRQTDRQMDTTRIKKKDALLNG